MALVKIDEDVAINTDHIESVQSKSRMTSQIIMASGEKHLTQFPFDVLIRRIEELGGRSVKSMISNIDQNTQRFAG